ncbi:MAG: hypothetical protein M0Z48_02430 [Nitrospiraceae bacterium]|nr:hypothetical protein [Nitrospiraceae bacterium]
MSPLEIICSGILVMALFAIVASVVDERQAKKIDRRKKDDKLDMIEEALKILAKKDRKVKEALMQVGFYRKKY